MLELGYTRSGGGLPASTIEDTAKQERATSSNEVAFLSRIDGFTVLRFLFPALLNQSIAGPEGGEEPSGGNVLRRIQIRLTSLSLRAIC